ncbi:MAG: hypothetical protein K8R87_11790 [Verrucomicrobia bacterium]|nr:hypothetical protein [Verrucomicrobiota bacterium]
MKWTLSLVAVPLLYLLSVPWVVRLDSKMFGFTFSGKFTSYYRPWKWLTQSETLKILLWDYALWCDGRAGEPEPPSIFSIMIMHPQEQP